MLNTFSFQDEFENEFWIQFKLLVKTTVRSKQLVQLLVSD